MKLLQKFDNAFFETQCRNGMALCEI